jgi:hypothetical protein
VEAVIANGDANAVLDAPPLAPFAPNGESDLGAAALPKGDIDVFEAPNGDGDDFCPNGVAVGFSLAAVPNGDWAGAVDGEEVFAFWLSKFSSFALLSESLPL